MTTCLTDSKIKLQQLPVVSQSTKQDIFWGGGKQISCWTVSGFFLFLTNQLLAFSLSSSPSPSWWIHDWKEPGWGFFATKQLRRWFLEFHRTRTMLFSQWQLRQKGSVDFCGIVGLDVLWCRGMWHLSAQGSTKWRRRGTAARRTSRGFWDSGCWCCGRFWGGDGFYRYEGIGIMLESEVQKNGLNFYSVTDGSDWTVDSAHLTWTKSGT